MPHLSDNERAAYWGRTLAPDKLIALSDHLATCAKCREELRRAQTNLVAPAAAEPISYEELVAWIEGDLDPLPRRALAEKIAASPANAIALVDLLQFRDEMKELPARDYAQATTTARFGGRAWMLPLAAGLALGCAVLWWNASGSKNHSGLALSDHGRAVTVQKDGAIPALGSLPPELQQSVQDAVSLGKVDRPWLLQDLRGASETLAGAPAKHAAFHLISPRATLVERERPVLRWSAATGASAYRVNLVNERNGAMISSTLLPPATTSWSPHEKLLPNDTYQWEVEALRGDELLTKAPAPPEPEARFRVLDPVARQKLEATRAHWGSSHLLMGLAYARAGLNDPARDEFTALARENPTSVFPRKLLAALEK